MDSSLNDTTQLISSSPNKQQFETSRNAIGPMTHITPIKEIPEGQENEPDSRDK